MSDELNAVTRQWFGIESAPHKKGQQIYVSTFEHHTHGRAVATYVKPARLPGFWSIDGVTPITPRLWQKV